MTDANFKNAGYALMTEEDPQQNITTTKKTYAQSSLAPKLLAVTIEKVNLCQRIFSILLSLHGVQPYTVGLQRANICLNRQQNGHQVFSNQNDTTLPLERL